MSSVKKGGEMVDQLKELVEHAKATVKELIATGVSILKLVKEMVLSVVSLAKKLVP